MHDYLKIENLKVNFNTYEGEKNVLDIDYLAMEKGKTFGLVGESGAGKSVLALTILGLLSVPPGLIKSGKIWFRGEDLLSKKDAEIRKIRGRKISMIFQDPMSTLNPVFTVGTQMMRVIQQNQKVGKKEAKRIAIEKIEWVKIPDAEDIIKSYPHELSGGQRQRIIIAIALSCGAELLIADEPTRNLDVTIQAGILKLIAKLQREFNISVLFIANNLGLVSAMCDNLAILQKGKIIEMGETEKVLSRPLHPYTKAIIQVMPKNKHQKVKLGGWMAGNDQAFESSGCRFIDICAVKEEKCHLSFPKLTSAGDSHFVACHKVYKENRQQ